MEIARVFLETSMSIGFQGIRELLKDAKINPDLLPDKSFIVFINKKCTKFKLLAGNSYLVYYNNGNRQIPLEAIQRLPEFFDGRRFNLKGAVQKTIESKVKTAVSKT